MGLLLLLLPLLITTAAAAAAAAAADCAREAIAWAVSCSASVAVLMVAAAAAAAAAEAAAPHRKRLSAARRGEVSAFLEIFRDIMFERIRERKNGFKLVKGRNKKGMCMRRLLSWFSSGLYRFWGLLRVTSLFLLCCRT
jgi:hypothetical protein